MGVEWDVTDAASPEGANDEFGTTEDLAQRGPPPRLVPLAAVCMAVLGGLLVATHQPRSPRSPIHTSVTLVPSPRVAPTAKQVAIARIRDLAVDPAPLSRYVRATTGGGCVLAQPGISPSARIATALRRWLPSYRVTDVGFIVEATDALCALQLRARDRQGDVLIIEVVAPATRPSEATAGHVDHGSHADRATASEYAVGVMPGGWQITVGAVGPTSQLPAIDLLIGLLRSPAARW